MKKMTKVLLIFVLMMSVLVGCSSKSSTPTRGVWEKNVYTSTFAKLTYTKPESWTSATDKEIAKLMNVSASELNDKNGFSKQALKESALFDMFVYDQETGTNLMVAYENLKASNSTKVSMDEYISTLKSKLVKNNGYASTSLKVENDIVIGEETYKVLKIDPTPNEAIQYYYMRKAGDYIVCIIITGDSNGIIEEILNAFS